VPRDPKSTLALALALFGILASRNALGAEPAEKAGAASLWRDEYPQFSALEGFLTSSSMLGIAIFLAMDEPKEAKWVGGILFDDAARDAFRLKDRDARRTAWRVGDITYWASPIVPYAIDGVIVALLARDDPKLAMNMMLVTTEAASYAGFLSFLSNKLALRERPDTTACKAANKEAAARCDLGGETEGFYSGHTTIAAAAAGAVCAHHAYVPLWGHPALDGLACALTTTSAAVTATTRVMADRHYLTDVIIGFGVGYGLGYMVPTLAHYAVPGSSTAALRVSPTVAGGDAGLTVFGTF
jgi:membrane-associated phospholipid phosphatase